MYLLYYVFDVTTKDKASDSGHHSTRVPGPETQGSGVLEDRESKDVQVGK